MIYISFSCGCLQYVVRTSSLNNKLMSEYVKSAERDS